MFEAKLGFKITKIQSGWLMFDLELSGLGGRMGPSTFSFMASDVQNDPVSEFLLVSRDLKKGLGLSSTIKIWEEPGDHTLYFARPSGVDGVLLSIFGPDNKLEGIAWLDGREVANTIRAEFGRVRGQIVPPDWKYGFPEILLPGRAAV